ncbi:MAG: hypothetical protein MUF54_11185 [Polyangiaceae bacterium]|jgi:hypothetical protein|nr:hypothetical protein [Polyangiaceae bacterium]
MFKILLGAMGGVFVGAFLLELLRQKKPRAIARVERRAKSLARDARLPIVVEFEPVPDR